MKIKNIITQLVFIFCAFSASSQSINYALNFSGNSKVDCYAMTELNNLANYSVQCLVNPSESLKNAYIFKRDEGALEFSLKFDATGKLLLTTGSQSIIVAEYLPANTWSQISIVALSTGIDVWINGSLSHKTAPTGAIIPSSASSFVIGEQYKGRIDEFRFWSCAIQEYEQENLMFSNTVNKFHPKYDNLLFYYKFDQDQCENIVDYKLKHHATPINATRVKVTDNEDFKYRVVSGYSSLTRHSDRLQIDKDMHIMTNDLIFLDADVNGTTGAIKMSYPHSQGVLTNAKFEKSQGNRQGVIHFNGAGAGMNVGNELFQTNNVPLKNATFESWINIERWVEGASLLFSKSDVTGKQIVIKLGNKAKKELIVLVDDYEYRFSNATNTTGWEHIGVCFNSEIPSVKLYCNATEIPLTTSKVGTSFTLYDGGGESILGKDFSGHMDAIMIWGANRADKLATDATETCSDLTFPGGGDRASRLVSYWKCDDPKDPGKNTRSWVTMINDVRDQNYSGHSGYKIRMGLVSWETINGNKTWVENISRQAWRDRLVKDVVEKILPYCDGIDVDFEWIYEGDSRWETGYGPMIEALRNVIDKKDKVFSVSLHAVSYWVPLKYINMPDYYTFQLYGPSTKYFLYENYTAAYDSFIKWGYSKEKIGLSFATLATTGKKVIGYKNWVDANPGITPDINVANVNNISYTSNGVDCVKNKMKFILEKNSGTVMYFDMGNDVSPNSNLSLIRAANSLISANVDSVIVNTKTLPIKKGNTITD